MTKLTVSLAHQWRLLAWVVALATAPAIAEQAQAIDGLDAANAHMQAVLQERIEARMDAQLEREIARHIAAVTSRSEHRVADAQDAKAIEKMRGNIARAPEGNAVK